MAKILIADDEELIRKLIGDCLIKNGHTVIEAEDGEKALNLFRKNPDINLALLDIMMPEIDGVETTHIIRRFHKEYDEVPIIALTANAVSGIKEMFIKEGMNDFIAKPIKVKENITIICSSVVKNVVPKKIRLFNKLNYNNTYTFILYLFYFFVK